MKLFPERKYTVELLDNSSLAIEHLIIDTKFSNSLVSELTDKAFIGQVQGNEFKVISSMFGFGVFCVLSGNLDGKEGVIKIRIHNGFKILTAVTMLLPIISVLITFIQRDVENPIGLLIPMLLGIIFVKFILIEFSFRMISRISLKKLTKIIGVSKINREA